MIFFCSERKFICSGFRICAINLFISFYCMGNGARVCGGGCLRGRSIASQIIHTQFSSFIPDFGHCVRPFCGDDDGDGVDVDILTVWPYGLVWSELMREV